jgi:hypothetical protein
VRYSRIIREGIVMTTLKLKETMVIECHDDDLINILTAGFFNNDELNIIEEKLNYLYQQQDEFNIYYDSLHPIKRDLMEMEGQLFPELWPFWPWLWLDKEKHQKLISYILLKGGFSIVHFGDKKFTYDSGLKINICDKEGFIKKKVINLAYSKGEQIQWN